MLIGLHEVAKRLGITYQTVFYSYIRTGKIKSIHLDKFYKVDTEDLEEFIRSREFKPSKKWKEKTNYGRKNYI